jgi:hypothetical protein
MIDDNFNCSAWVFSFDPVDQTKGDLYLRLTH